MRDSSLLRGAKTLSQIIFFGRGKGNILSFRNLSLARPLRIVGIFLFCASLTMAQEIDTEVPVGWAVVPGYGMQSTTGGGNGDVVTATTASQLVSYAASSLPLVILVEGLISGDGDDWVDVNSNKTIIGQGADARLSGIGISLSNVSNVIIRNLTISGAVDAIATRGSHHVWIDHCDVSDCGDGLIDITNESDLHTVSWTRFSNHDKTMLINSGTSKPDDLNTLNTTLHHLWYDRSNQRNPRVGYGKVHMFNCLQSYNGSYGIGLHSQARVLAEQNYFDHVPNAIQQMYRLDPNDIHHGFCESVGNLFESCTGKRDDEGISFPVDNFYMYEFILDTASSVPAIVEPNVGPGEMYDSLGLIPTPGNGRKNLGTSPNLRWTKGQSAIAYIVNIGTSIDQLADSTVSGQTYSPGPLDSATVYFWRVDQITSIDTVQGKIWVFETSVGLPAVTITSPTSETVFDGATSDITISADATDYNGTIVQVEFFRGVTSLGVDDTFPYSFTWTNALAGEHMISAKATDNQGNTVTSPLVYIKKENNAPTVSILSPSVDTTYDAPTSITISANAKDNDGSINDVTFYQGTSILGRDYTSPYSVTWDKVANGQYIITAVATDNLEATTTSAAVSITIENVALALTDNYGQDVNVYPIPADNFLNIEFGSLFTAPVNIHLLDLSGHMLYTTKADGIRQTLDLSAFPDGYYLIKISGENINVTQKITKQ